MAIQITFDSSHNVISPALVLTSRNGNRLGGLLYHNLVVKQAIRQSIEMSFSVNKSDYCKKNHNANLWSLITDFKLVWCKEWNCYFEITVTTNEEYTTEKEITAVSLGKAELSQINLYNIQINTEDDIAREDYEPTVLYNENNTNASILHRIMEKTPHYIVKYVDPVIANIQRTFTFDNTSLYNAFQEIAEEMECVFDIECRHTVNGIERSISIYALENYGNDTNILLTTDSLADNVNYSIDSGAVKNCFRLEGGDDLMTATIRNCNPNGSGYIWYISDELKSDMSDELVEQLNKYNKQYNYFYKYYNPFDAEIKNYTGKMLVGRLLEDYGYGGNVDLLRRPLVPVTNIANSGWSVDTAKSTETLHIVTYPKSNGMVAGNFTPIMTDTNGSYVRTLSPSELKEYVAHVFNGETNDAETSKLQIGSLFYGNDAVQKAKKASQHIIELQNYYYDADNLDEFIDSEMIAEFNNSIANKTDIINNYNTLVRKYQTYTEDYKEIKTPINGYPAIMEAYYNTIDFYYYLNDSLMPTLQMSDTNAQAEANKLHYQSLKNTAVQNLSGTTSVATVSSAITAMAKAIVDTRYQIKVLDNECSFNFSTTADRSSVWNGKIQVTNYSDEEDTYTVELRSIPISSDYATFVQQKLNTVLANTRTDTVADISDIFKMDNSHFKAELKKYSLKRLEAFHDACQSCIDVLIQQGIANNSNTESNMHQQIYLPYYNKLGFIQSEMDVRQGELDVIAGKFDSKGGLISDGMQTILRKERDNIQANLDFQDYLGSKLWQEFVAYRREDTFSNTNYVSDGLGNDELFARAMEFIQTANEEIEKSATKQHTINARLKNLLVMKEFSSIVDCFEVGNWLRLKVDDKLFKLRLVDYQIDFENLESIDITFSDIVVDGTEATAKDILNQAANMATSYNAVSRQARKGDKASSMVDNFVNDGLALTTTKIIDTVDNQEVSWDKHGLVCREYDSLTDSYSDTQVKLINKGVYVTDNKWRTAKAGIGNFTFFNPTANNGEGEYQEAYGVIADTLVGNLILGQKVGIYNTKNSVTMDENGFVLTTDGTGSDDPQSVFTIRRKTINNGTKSFKDMFYIDSNGFVTINGGVKIDIDGENNNSTMVEMVDGKITAHITNELENSGLIQSSISQTASEIKNTVAEAVSKYDETGYIISVRDYGTPHTITYPPSNYNNLLYLDQKTGYVYKSNGSSWSRHRDNDNEYVSLPLITTNLASSIAQTASSILSTVSNTYETKSDSNNKKTALESSIQQTAANIASTVKVTSGWDIFSLGYTISLIGTVDRGNDHSVIGDYSAGDYIGKFYLDDLTGHVYESKLENGSSTEYVWWWKANLTRVDSSIYSRIDQTANSITSTVSATYETKTDANTKKTNLESSISQTAASIKSTVAEAINKYDETGYTIIVRDYGSPNINIYAPSDYINQLYLDQENGYVYTSNGSVWNRHQDSENQNVTLPLITAKLQSQITQNASSISSKVSAGDVHSIIQQTPEDVRIAWNGISSYISFENAAIKIKNSSNNLLMQLNNSGMNLYDGSSTLLSKLDSNGISLYESVGNSENRLTMRFNRSGSGFYNEGNYLGRIGTNKMAGNSTIRGLTFNLESILEGETARYMAWSYLDGNNGNAYTVKMAYYTNDFEYTYNNVTQSFNQGFYFSEDVYFLHPVYLVNGASIQSNSYNGVSLQCNNMVHLEGNGGEITLNNSCVFLQPSNGGHIGASGDLHMNNYIIYDTNVTSSSDARLKKNITLSSVKGLAVLNNIEVSTFDWIATDKHVDAGLIAQQLRNVIPDAVLENPSTNRLSIKTDTLIPYIIKAIQELTQYIENDDKCKTHLPLLDTEIIKSKSKWTDNANLKQKAKFLLETKPILPDDVKTDNKQYNIFLPG